MFILQDSMDVDQISAPFEFKDPMVKSFVEFNASIKNRATQGVSKRLFPYQR